MRPYSGRKCRSRRSAGRPSIRAVQRLAPAPSADSTSSIEKVARRCAPLGGQRRAQLEPAQDADGTLRGVPVAIRVLAGLELTAKARVAQREVDRTANRLRLERRVD